MPQAIDVTRTAGDEHCDEHSDITLDEQPRPEPDPRAQYIRGLREIADWLQRHPEVHLPYLGDTTIGSLRAPTLDIYVHKSYGDEPSAKARLAAIARAMGHATKSADDDDHRFRISRMFGGIRVRASAPREEVCERIVVASHQVTEQVPDPEAVAALPLVSQTRVVEEVVWRCTALLDDDDDAVSGV